MQGYVQVYTGDGKGKTTAALGLAIRALGAGKRVLFVHFMKTLEYSENKVMARLAPDLTTESVGKPFFIALEGTLSDEDRRKWQDKIVIFPPGQPPKDYVDIVATGLKRAKEAVESGEYDLVVLDEVICALYFGLLTWKDLLALIDSKASKTELVLTGRGASRELLERADLVTEMKEIKHYYATLGVEARLGIEN